MYVSVHQFIFYYENDAYMHQYNYDKGFKHYMYIWLQGSCLRSKLQIMFAQDD